MVWLGQAFLLADEYEKAGQTLEELKELADRCGARHYLGWAHYLLGEVALKTSQPHAADDFCQSIAIFRETKAENDLALAYAGYGRLHKQEGRRAESREYLAMALEIFERLGTLSLPDEVRRELAELSEEARVFRTEKALPLRG
jgi:tetratricopeptide (TPR) repeat protein